jgi:hypothetical protein
VHNSICGKLVVDSLRYARMDDTIALEGHALGRTSDPCMACNENMFNHMKGE